MGALTPTSVVLESAGSTKLWVATFSNIDNDDTWASGIVNMVDVWCNASDNPTTQASNGIDVSYTSATGAVTFRSGEAGRVGKVYALSVV